MEKPPANKTFSMFGKQFAGVVVKKPLTGCPINLLMLRDKLPMSLDLGPEDRFGVVLADRLRELTLTHKLAAVWSHIPNEGKRHRFVAMILKAIGLIPGATDYYFVWATGGGFIEIKVHPNKLTDPQGRYRDWCISKGVKWACVVCEADTLEARMKGVAEVESHLRAWGALA